MTGYGRELIYFKATVSIVHGGYYQMRDYIILVNNEDEEIGYGDKMEVHQKGLLHRAFSLFIENEEHKILIQKRACNKYHSGGLWTNACCSHPRKGENIETAICRRVFEELGLDISDASSYELGELGKFKYIKHFDDCTEYEIDHVFILNINDDTALQPNANEIEELKWIDLWDLEDWLLATPDDFTAWFFAVYNMYVWEGIWNCTMMCSPISKELDRLLRQRMEDVCYVGSFN